MLHVLRYGLICLCLCTAGQLVAQCDPAAPSDPVVIVNEVGNDGFSEYIELLVIGYPGDPVTPVDMRDWIIDDNNAPAVDIGNEPGHMRFGNCYGAMQPGTLILVSTTQCMYGIEGSPNHTSPDYIRTPANWQRDRLDWGFLIPLRNEGDAAQIRDANARLIHAISWGNASLGVYMTLPGPTASGYSFQFKGGLGWNDPASFGITPFSSGTPGRPNSEENAAFIQKLKTGSAFQTLTGTATLGEQATTAAGGQVSVTVGGGTPPYSITISNDNFGDGQTATTPGTYSFDNVPAGTYEVLVEDIKGCSQTMGITMTKAPEVCPGSCQDIGLQNTNNYCSLAWDPHPDIKPPFDVGIKNVCPTETTTYTLRALRTNGKLDVFNYTVQVKSVSITPNPALVCGTASATLRTSSNFSTYSWSTGATTPAIRVTTRGMYTVTVVDDQGCELTGTTEVSNGQDCEAIKQYFLSLGFTAITDMTVIDIPGLVAPPPKESIDCLIDEAVDEVRKDGNFFDINALLKPFCGEAGLTQIWLTDNEALCKGDLKNTIEASLKASNTVGWVHLYRCGVESIVFMKLSQPSPNLLKCSGDFRPLTKDFLETYYKTKCCPGCSEGTIQNNIGHSFEDMWHDFAKENFNSLSIFDNDGNPLLWNYRPFPQDQIVFGTRNTIPDGHSNSIIFKLSGSFFRLRVPFLYKDARWYEVKATDGRIYNSYNNYQVSSHIIALASLQSGPAMTNRAAMMNIVTTSDATLSPSLIKTANSTNIILTHWKPCYQIRNGQVEVIFQAFQIQAILQVIFIPSGDPETIEIGIPVPGTITLKPVILKC